MILELGSGQSLASLHLLSELRRIETSKQNGHDRERKRAEVYLTDLEGVIPLVEENVERWRRKIRQDGSACLDNLQQDDANPSFPGEDHVDVRAYPLPWGESAAADRLLASTGKENMGITHILMIDLVGTHVVPITTRD